MIAPTRKKNKARHHRRRLRVESCRQIKGLSGIVVIVSNSSQLESAE
jgi:hypothetical protein